MLELLHCYWTTHSTRTLLGSRGLWWFGVKKKDERIALIFFFSSKTATAATKKKNSISYTNIVLARSYTNILLRPQKTLSV
jgi:hypothetical protein